MEKIYKYNTYVRQRISDEYVSSLKRRTDLIKQRNNVFAAMEVDGISHAEYLKLDKLLEQIKINLIRIDTAIRIWDKAREICLDVADEVKL